MLSSFFSLGLFDGGTQQPDSHLNSFSIEYPEDEVLTATRNFDSNGVLGSGTFGSVYKGTMRDGTEVAVKLLQVPEEAGFEEEVKVLSRFRHPNLVILMGFSRHAVTGARSLIYEYLAGGDASRRLQRSRSKVEPFEWKQRLSTALDAASGLSHLHNANPRAFHRDIKGPNILLDKNGTAKMADFGLSCVSQYAHHKVQQASGTVGYACPEYIRSGIITEGSEVHSFGMVLLELLTGAPPAVQRPDKPKEFCYLVDHLQGSSEKVIEMLDQTGNFPLRFAETLIRIAFNCILVKSVNRPSFVQLVGELRRLLSEPEQQWLSEPEQQSPPRQAAGETQEYTGPEPRPGSAVQPHRTGGYPKQQGEAHQLPVVPAGVSVGHVVEARRQGALNWVQGRILRANGNDTFAIEYDDHSYEDQVPMHCIRQIESKAVVGSVGWEQSPKQGSVMFLAPEALQRVESRFAPEPHVIPEAHDCPAHVAEKPPEVVKTPEQNAVQRQSRLFCIFSEGVSDLNSLDAQQRAIDFPSAGDEFLVGRTVQPAAFWDVLIPNPRLRGTVSREHFKIIAKTDLDDQQFPTFSLLCMSANGLLLNGVFVRNTDGLRPLRPGDIIAFGINLEPAESDREGAAGASSRKPFVAFTFGLQSAKQPPAPAAEQTAAAVPQRPSAGPPAAQAWEQEEGELPAPKPPKGTIAGKWRSSKTGGAPLDSMVFCLEVHGENVRSDLPREARQLVYCHSSSSSSSPPALRVGWHYQRDFWRRVMRFGVASKFLEPDHFEIVLMPRSNLALFDPLECKCRVRVLASTGLSINYRTLLDYGGECELYPSDTLTVASLAGTAETRGLHFTFIPYADSSKSSQPSEATEEASRRLPDFPEPDVETHGDGRLVMERTIPSDARSSLGRLSDGAAGALKPPSAASSGVPERQPSGGGTPANAALLEPMVEDREKGDLFSKTGFGTLSDA